MTALFTEQQLRSALLKRLVSTSHNSSLMSIKFTNNLTYVKLLIFIVNTDIMGYLCGPDSVVDIATAYGLDGSGIESR